VVQVVFIQAKIKWEPLAAADLMQEYSDGIGRGQPKLLQDQLGLALEAVVNSCTDI
jgi:hypothetical protein